MIVVRIVVNALIMAAEIAAIAGLAWLGYNKPYVFAAATVVAAFALGFVLEQARFKNDLPFFFEKVGWLRKLVYGVVAAIEAIIKALMAGLVALITFSGTDDTRRYWIAVAFALTVWIGAAALRRLAISFNARASRWGYFRLALPLGLVFSLGVTGLNAFDLVKTPSIWDLWKTAAIDLPSVPSLEQMSELLFKLKLFFDGLIAAILGKFLPAALAQAIGVLVSVNTLTGFVAAVYAVLVSEAVLGAEDWNG